jgi:ketosteroid isomerase-like protein
VSRENVERLRRSNAAFNLRDYDGVFADYRADVEWRDLQHAPDAPESLCGTSALRDYWAQWQDAFDELTAEIEEYIDAGDFVLALTHWRAQGRDSGLVIDQRTVDVYEFADGKILRATVGYADKATALHAVGREEPA